MQTFLPYSDFKKSAACLDYKRLGKQRVEAFQIYNICKYKRLNSNIKVAWGNHPAVLMWLGYEEALANYYNVCLEEWIRRGFNNTMKFIPCSSVLLLPVWLGDVEFHKAHRSNLLRKYPEWYSQFGWTEKADIKYVWPVRKYCG